MGVVPSRTEDLLLWADQHANLWASAGVGAQIGLTPAQTTFFSGAYGTAASDFSAKLAARDALEGATTKSQDSVRDLRRAASDMIRFIRAFAESQSKPAIVYATAQIPPPAAPTPVGPPGTPFDFRAVLNPDGSMSIRWKCNNPEGSTGTVYTVKRRTGTQANYEIVGATGSRRFEDETFGGSTTVSYIVQAQRSTQVGLQSSPFTVQFGQAGGGGFVITNTFEGDGEQAKLAA
jgi:hypothetical protein